MALFRLDTLLLMGLDEEVDAARQWIESNLDFNVNADVSAFEFCIRFLGGLLGAYAMTHDQLYADKAEDLGKRLLPIFNTPTGVPKATVNLRTGKTANWVSGGGMWWYVVYVVYVGMWSSLL